jgi:hypothetical protein
MAFSPIVPTIHSNGSDGGALREQYANAHAALESAITALTNACPHERDYYIRGPEAYKQAMREHTKRMHALYEARDDMREIVSDLDEQMERRADWQAHHG